VKSGRARAEALLSGAARCEDDAVGAALARRDARALGDAITALAHAAPFTVAPVEGRWVSLGARLRRRSRPGGADVAEATLYLVSAQVAAQAPAQESVSRLVERWPLREGPPAQHQVWRGLPLGALARGQLVVEGARREGDRLHLTRGATSVTPQRGAWDTLPVAFTRVAALPPPAPPWAPPAVAALRLGAVTELGFARGAQTLYGEVADPHGARLPIALPHRAETPGAIDALAAALDDAPRWISGIVRARQGRATLEPLAVVTDRVLSIDLETAPARALPDATPPDRGHALVSSRAIAALDALALRALDGAPDAFPPEGLSSHADALRAAGLDRCAAALEAVRDPASWLDASTRLRLARSLA